MARCGIACLLAGCVVLCGCVHTAPEPLRTYPVSSESSDYSPVARLMIAVSTRMDSVIVTVESAEIRVPATNLSGGPALMRDLTLGAILAVKQDSIPGAGRSNAARAPWMAVAVSDSVLVADSLHAGEIRVLRGLHFRLLRPARVAPQDAWIVFRISGTAVMVFAARAGGGASAERTVPGGVRVYACADRDLLGSVDADRASRLRLAYEAAC